MRVNNLPKVATQWNSGTTRDSNSGRRVLIPSALTTTPLSHTGTHIPDITDHHGNLNVYLMASCVRNRNYQDLVILVQVSV